MRYLIKVLEEGYEVKNKTDAKHKPRGGDFIFLESEVELTYPIVGLDENDDLILIEDPIKIQEDLDRKYQRDRKSEYELQGLTFDYFLEMLIENDASGMAAYRSSRDKIKLDYPKPIEGEV